MAGVIEILSMEAYHVMVGELRLGPFSLEELAEKIGAGEITLDQPAWTEGMEDWLPVSEILAAEGASVEILQEEGEEAGGTAGEEGEEGEVEDTLLQGPGFVVTPDHLVLGEEVWHWGALNRAEVEVEHTQRGRALLGTILFGVAGLVVLLLPLFHDPGMTALWVVWGVFVAGFVIMFCRNAFAAFGSAGTFLAVHLADGDDRILPLSQRAAGEASALINERIRLAREADEE